MKQYTILTYNIGGYDVLREIKHKSPKAEYIYVTDDRSIVSETWDVRYIDNPYPEDVFYTCYYIRFNPFDFANTDVVVRIDGSVQVLDNIDKIIDYFNKEDYDICLDIHPTRHTVCEEYEVWCNDRGYSRSQAERVMSYMADKGYDTENYRGLYQYGLMIQRRNPVNLELNAATLDLIRQLAPEGKQVERLDQTIGSFVINSQFSERLKVMAVDERIFHSKFFRLFKHGNWEEINFNGKYIRPYLFNKPAKIARLNYHAKAKFMKFWFPLPIVRALHSMMRVKDCMVRIKKHFWSKKWF